MQTVRLFIGSHINSNLILPHFKPIRQDFSAVCHGKWVEPQNLHFTFKFIGDVALPIAKDLKIALNDILTTHNSEINIKGMGVFPNPNSPRVLFIKIFNHDNIIRTLHSDIEKKLIPFNFPSDGKKFSPHLTLCRIKSSDSDKFPTMLSKYSHFDFGTMPNFKIALIKSTLTPSGPIYQEI